MKPRRMWRAGHRQRRFGAAERVVDGETGWIYPSGDLARLEQCLLHAP
jgi:hypothetical protein